MSFKIQCLPGTVSTVSLVYTSRNLRNTTLVYSLIETRCIAMLLSLYLACLVNRIPTVVCMNDHLEINIL